MDIKKILIIAIILILAVIGILTTPLFKKPPSTDLKKLSYINKSLTPTEVYFILGEELNRDCINEAPQCFYFSKEVDISTCANIPDDDQQLGCKASFSYDVGYCNQMQDKDLKFLCLFHLTNILENCKQIEDSDYKNWCFAEFYNSVNYCNKIQTGIKNVCFYRLTGDREYCFKYSGSIDLCGLSPECKDFEKCFIQKIKYFAYSYENHNFCKYFEDSYLIGLCSKTSREILK